MGDRGNIVIRYDADTNSRQTDIYFYAHWRGSDLPSILQRALARRLRWHDAAYLARIIFNELTAGHETEETGFGIAPYLCDNEHDLLIVDVARNIVIRQTEDGKLVSEWPFEEFITLNSEAIAI